MDNIEFREIVAEMRRAQKEYFRTRNPGVLKAAKAYERAVDQAIEDYINPQGQLFEEASS